MHVHVISPAGEAKFWIEPIVSLATFVGFSKRQLANCRSWWRNERMKSAKRGKNTSKPEVTNISEHGFWILLSGREHFLPFDHFPWFKDANVGQLTKIELWHSRHLYWPELDVDLSIDIIEHPEKYPLLSRS